jgi:hypothetical protein
VIAASLSVAAVVGLLRVWKPRGEAVREVSTIGKLSSQQAFAAWLPWVILSVVMILWSWLGLLTKGQLSIPIPTLHNQVLITLYQKPYSALYGFQPLAAGTAVFVSVLITALCFRVRPGGVATAGWKTLRQLAIPGLTVMTIVGLTYLYNYSGMAFTLGAAAARVGPAFPILSSYLGWLACFLSGSDSASNLLFGPDVAADGQRHPGESGQCREQRADQEERAAAPADGFAIGRQREQHEEDQHHEDADRPELTAQVSRRALLDGKGDLLHLLGALASGQHLPDQHSGNA